MKDRNYLGIVWTYLQQTVQGTKNWWKQSAEKQQKSVWIHRKKTVNNKKLLKKTTEFRKAPSY